MTTNPAAAPGLPTKLPAQGVPPSVAHVEADEDDNRKLKFSDERINKALDKQLGSLPSDTKYAIVATAFKDHNGVIQTKLAAYYNIPFNDKNTLSFGGFIEGDTKRPLDTVGVEVRLVGR